MREALSAFHKNFVTTVFTVISSIIWTIRIIWPMAVVAKMTYNVSGCTLSLTHLQYIGACVLEHS